MRTLYSQLKDKLDAHVPVVPGLDVVQTWMVSSDAAHEIICDEEFGKVEFTKAVEDGVPFSSFKESFWWNVTFFRQTEPKNKFGVLLWAANMEMTSFMVYLVRRRSPALRARLFITAAILAVLGAAFFGGKAMGAVPDVSAPICTSPRMVLAVIVLAWVTLTLLGLECRRALRQAREEAALPSADRLLAEWDEREAAKEMVS